MYCKSINANAILGVFGHIMQANLNSGVEYVPMIFIHAHVLDGGRNRAMFAFMAEKLLTDEMRAHVTTIPSGRDDDIAQLTYLKRENENGRLTFIISNDLFTEHVQSGLVSAEFLKRHLISFAFVADTSDVLLMKPECEELDAL